MEAWLPLLQQQRLRIDAVPGRVTRSGPSRDTPPRVAIDEAVELAKRFGTAQSAQFVNGILDKLLTDEQRRRVKDEG